VRTMPLPKVFVPVAVWCGTFDELAVFRHDTRGRVLVCPDAAMREFVGYVNVRCVGE
jgi:hypothetical protein